MKLYIAGPMSGHPGLNFPAFHTAAEYLRIRGHDVVNPAEINPALDADWLACMEEDLQAMATCEGVFFLEGWEKSKGARIEYTVAKILKLKIFHETYEKDYF